MKPENIIVSKSSRRPSKTVKTPDPPVINIYEISLVVRCIIVNMSHKMVSVVWKLVNTALLKLYLHEIHAFRFQSLTMIC